MINQYLRMTVSQAIVQILIFIIFFILTQNLPNQSVKASVISRRDQYDEELIVRPLRDGKLFAQFKFRTLYGNDFKSLRWENKLQIFPLSIAELISVTDLKKLHFSLTKGNWNNRNWGYSSRPSPPGAQIRVNFSQHNESPAKAWDRLVNLLAGKFCASLIGADSRTRVASKLAFRDENLENSTLTSETFYANLPEETLCTENITPWKKLLPCEANSGLASLLNPENILKSSYSSLALDLEPVNCRDDKGLIISGCERVQLTQTFSVVFNPILQFEGKQAWSIIKTFGRGLERTCQAAISTKIRVDITDLDDINKLYPSNFESQNFESKHFDGSTFTRNYALYDINSYENSNSENRYTWPFNVGIKQKSIFKYQSQSFKHMPVDFKTSIAGYQGTDGTHVATITNNLDEEISITYMEIIPHFIKFYSHSLTIMSKKSGNILNPLESAISLSEGKEPSSIEITLRVSANDQVQIYYNFEGSYLRWTDYKPDANKGVLLESASLRLTYCPKCLNYSVIPMISNNLDSNLTDKIHPVRLYARPLLIIQPTPDFSMPYNVICLVCTVLVAGFGPIHNLTTRKAIINNIAKEKVE